MTTPAHLDPTTWANIRPTHPVRPAWLIEAKEAAAALWAERDAIIENRAAYQNDADYWDDLAIVTGECNAAEQWVLDCCQHYNAGTVPASIQFEQAAQKVEAV